MAHKLGIYCTATHLTGWPYAVYTGGSRIKKPVHEAPVKSGEILTRGDLEDQWR